MIKRLDCPLLALSGLIRFEEKSFFFEKLFTLFTRCFYFLFSCG